MKTIKSAVLVFGFLVASIGQIFCQTIPQFTSAVATTEKAIQLYWTSTNGELYQVQYANALATNSDGSTAWQVLYDSYPSQGTNTFIGDFGNYNVPPQITHPKYNPMRFYQILDEGPDSLTDEPTVALGSITNNSAATGELTFTVTAATDQPGLGGTTLYVDGQEMQPANDTTNYTIGATNYETDTYSINTCEWLNGTHILYATTIATSQYSSQQNSGAILTGHAVSPFVSLLFSNLVEEISFSQPSFDPSQGETQQVSAVFAANCNWTLNIEDVNSNIVQAASGSGSSMQYNWDGTSNETNIPNGLYFYYISAAINGEAPEVVTSGGGSGGGSPPSPDAAGAFSSGESSELWAISADGGNALPLALYPPGFDTNGMTIVSATPSEISAARTSPVRASFRTAGSGGGFTADDSGGGGSGASSQNSPASPQRPPNNPIKGMAGKIGIAADTYTGNGTNGLSCGPLSNGLLPTTYVSMYTPQNPSGSTAATLNPPRPVHKVEASTFVKTMQFYGWSNPLNEIDSQLNINDLRGSGSPYNNMDMAICMFHGTYGVGSASTDYAANSCKQMYYVVGTGSHGQYLRLSEMNLGGSSTTNGLKWMVIDACYSLYQANWSSMKNKGVKPYNGNMHMILGATTEIWTSALKWYNFAKYMNFGRHNFYSPYTIRNAYYQGNQDAFQNADLPEGTTITLSVVGDSACLDDSLQTNTPPSGSWQYDSLEVFSN